MGLSLGMASEVVSERWVGGGLREPRPGRL